MIKNYLNYTNFLLWLEERSAPGHSLRLEEDSLISDQAEICRLPLIHRDLDLQSFDELDELLDEPDFYGIFLIQAGRASLGLAQADRVLATKQIRKYMVRKTQGKSQLAYLHEKGKSRLGSRIRLRQTDQFFVEINQQWQEWQEEYAVKRIFLSCSPKLKGAWFAAKSSTALRNTVDSWVRIPFHVDAPSFDELQRIHTLLCRAQIVENSKTNTDV
ncbi:MAG: hypothetical protein ACOH5I_08585 [Oligoflexus sp.]